MMQNFKKDLKDGFSLIEVMVATTILLVVVLMIGSVFRQGTSSWDSGYARAEGGMIVRAVVGSIQRELSTAVDGRRFKDKDQDGKYITGAAWSSPNPVEVSQNKIKFICMKESVTKKENGNLVLKRDPWLVEYVWGGEEMTRNAYRLDCTIRDKKVTWSLGTNVAQGDKVNSTVYSQAFQEGKKAWYSADFRFVAVPDAGGIRDYEAGDFDEKTFWDIPYVSIRVDLTRTSSFSGLEVASRGPDGKPGTDDDILVK